MSRIGKQPIPVPVGVDITLKGPHLKIKGSLGELEHDVPGLIEVAYDEAARMLIVTRKNDSRSARALHGLHRSLLANKVQGVSTGFEKRLEIYGTGYNINLRGETLVLNIGFCHEVVFDVPDGITVDIEQNAAAVSGPARFTVKGVDKQLVGQFAANVRAVRPPEPYKGKGIRYVDEYVRRKEGKAFAGLER